MLAYSLTVVTACDKAEPLLVETIAVDSDTEAVFLAKDILSAFRAKYGEDREIVAALKDDAGDLVWRSDASQTPAA